MQSAVKSAITAAQQPFYDLLNAEAKQNIKLASKGRVLIIADNPEKLLAAAHGLRGVNNPLKFVLRDDTADLPASELAYIHIQSSCELSGVFSKFSLKAQKANSDTNIALSADMVIDLSDMPLLNRGNKTVGYFSEISDVTLTEIEGLTGEFLKPVYIQVNNSVCAYGNGALDGCNACLSACEFDAVKVEKAKIYIDNELCQGSGGCAAVCPSNAISYQLPTRQTFVNLLRSSLYQFIERTQTRPTVRFVSAANVESLTANSETEIIIPLDEQDWLDASMLLLSLCYGALAVVVDNVSRQNQTQIKLANDLLAMLGYSQAIYSISESAESVKISELTPAIELLTRATSGDKHSELYLAIDHLFAQTQLPATALELPFQAELGEILIQTNDCTLCLSCVAVCPSLALKDMGEKPGILFKEQNCLQCGLCQSACPEKVITLNPRLQLDKDKRQNYRVLNEDKVLECIRCHTPFATESMIAAIEAKIGNHAMFADEKAKKRLRMCADCRVKDMME